MTCPRKECRHTQCYVCSKSCDYGHFDRSGGDPHKCPLYDQHDRHEEEVKKAEEAARKVIIEKNPDVDQEHLAIKMSKVVSADDKARSRQPWAGVFHQGRRERHRHRGDAVNFDPPPALPPVIPGQEIGMGRRPQRVNYPGIQLPAAVPPPPPPPPAAVPAEVCAPAPLQATAARRDARELAAAAMRQGARDPMLGLDGFFPFPELEGYAADPIPEEALVEGGRPFPPGFMLPPGPAPLAGDPPANAIDAVVHAERVLGPQIERSLCADAKTHLSGSNVDPQMLRGRAAQTNVPRRRQPVRNGGVAPANNGPPAINEPQRREYQNPTTQTVPGRNNTKKREREDGRAPAVANHDALLGHNGRRQNLAFEDRPGPVTRGQVQLQERERILQAQIQAATIMNQQRQDGAAAAEVLGRMRQRVQGQVPLFAPAAMPQQPWAPMPAGGQNQNAGANANQARTA